MKRIAALAVLLTGCCATGLAEQQDTARLCSGATVEFKPYGFRAVRGNSEFIHIESYSGLSMEVPGGCNNILNQRGDNEWYIRSYEDNACNGSVDVFYREFRRNRQEPVVQKPAGSIEATTYYSEYFEMNIPEAQRRWEAWKNQK